MPATIDRQALLERFLRYARVETTSDDANEATPSSECQWDLSRMLEAELREMGVEDVLLDDHAYVYAKLPERLPAGHPRAGKIPTVGFLAHVDVSPAVSGEDVKPIVHDYEGGAIELNGVTLTPETDAPLGECVGCQIVTSDGTTLLGADDKAGVAVIMTLLDTLIQNPEIPHGPIAVAFTPDEEIGRGTACFDLEKFGAEVAYTVDGETLGEIEEENFCADGMVLVFKGINVHPGYAKGKLVSAIKVAADFMSTLPKYTLSPETTEGYEGFVHPYHFEGNEERAEIRFIIRDFAEEGLTEKEALLERLAAAAVSRAPGSGVERVITTQYRNMRSMIAQRPEVTEMAVKAIERAGVDLLRVPIRGGTDGARLSFMGLPTPNLFTGGHNFHSRREWIAVEHMLKSAEVALNLVDEWLEHGEIKGLLEA